MTELVDIHADLVHETDQSYLIDDGDREVWLPKSMTEYDDIEDIFSIPLWLAQEKGLI